MKTALIILGSDSTRSAGKLNRHLYDKTIELLSPKYKTLTTHIEEGYEFEVEFEKFQASDCVIFQYPIYWYQAPAIFKQYLEDVYRYGSFFSFGEQGPIGLMKDKQYMLSSTWLTASDWFKPNAFFDGKSPDDVQVSLHKTQQYCGMTPLKSFSVHGVGKDLAMEPINRDFEAHLKTVFNLG